MSVWKRAMDYLGLGDDAAYDDYDAPEPERPNRSRGGYPPEPGRRGGYEHPDDDVRPMPPRGGSADTGGARRYPLPGAEDSGVQPRPVNAPRQGSAVRTVTPAAPPGEPVTVRPRRFDQAQEVADKFKDGQAVIMNLEGTERDVSRRLIDFASGLCYALNGSMEKVATGVYLLKPAAARADERRGGDYDDDV
jgi:cell division inhibitor SepF